LLLASVGGGDFEHAVNLGEKLLIVYTEEDKNKGFKAVDDIYSVVIKGGGGKNERNKGEDVYTKGQKMQLDEYDVTKSLKIILENTKCLHSMKLNATEDLVSYLL
jgi:hypothetical protein